MLFYVLIICTLFCTHAFDINVEKILLRTKCTIPIVNSTAHVAWHKPFLLRNTKYTNDFIKNEMSIHNLIHKYGNKTVGIDFPGPAAAPTEAWRSIKLRDYVQKYVLHNKTYDEYIKSEQAILWGPTDSCEHTGGCECEGMYCKLKQKFVPINVSESFVCHELDNITGMIYGLAGKYGGLHFHRHSKIYNQLLYGKKLWYFLDNRHPLKYINTTSAQTVYDMLLREMYPKHDACIQEEGDFVYIPDNYWHMTFNFDAVFMAGCLYDPYLRD